MNLKRDINALLEKEGFRLVRTGRHETWSDGKITLNISVSPSDKRALKMVRTEIARKRRGHYDR